MKNRKISLVLFVFLVLLKMQYSNAQAPAGYYNAAQNLTGSALKTALHNIISNHDAQSYGSLYGFMQNFDIKNGKVWDIYSDIPNGIAPYSYTYGQDECGNYNSEGDCFNREHSWPESWFNGASVPRTDLFHIYPTDGYVNNQRSNLAYSEVDSAVFTSLNGCKKGYSSFPGYSGAAFEPIDEYKGDLARSYFYMSTRYLNEDNSWIQTAMTNKAQLNPWAVNLLLQWHHQDTVSTKEIIRNNSIYAIQDNRNPFIDRPQWADSIWTFTVAINDPKHNQELFTIQNKSNTIEILKNNAKPYLVSIISLDGKVVLEESIQNAQSNLYFSNRGFFIVQIKEGDIIVKTQKLII
jgi:endonuclease I